MILNIKENINKIDYELKNLFENVYITEKAIKNNFFIEIKANKLFLFENCKKRIEVLININKNNLITNNINWAYSINPLDEKSSFIERTSNISNISNDIYDIAQNKRMVNEYFSNLDSQVDLILENSTDFETEGLNFVPLIVNTIKKYTNINELITKINHEGGEILCIIDKLKISDKFLLEKELLTNERVDFVSYVNEYGVFNDNNIKIKVN